MPAAIYRRPGELEIIETEVPSIGPADVLVEVEYCGICGTDLHMVLDGWGTPDSIGGHEWSGRVVVAGPDADVAEGTLVAGNADTTCHECEECRRGRPSLCTNRPPAGKDGFQGAFARYVASSAGAFVTVPSGVDARAAAYTEPLAVGMHAITLAAPMPGARVVVFGAGPIGAAIVAVLRTRGVDDITVVEPGDVRRRLAEQLGARGCEPDDLDVPGHPQSLVDRPADVVFETSGTRTAAETGLAQLRRGGTMMIVGTGLDRPRLDTHRLLLNELLVTGAFNYDADGFTHALDLIASGRLPLDLLVEDDPVGLDDMLDAMTRLRSGQTAGKVLVRPMEDRR
jgi:(R,R)-butanediol dehydrogenase/meso-butanediol dehydrogenase/diacetyl reductase